MASTTTAVSRAWLSLCLFVPDNARTLGAGHWHESGLRYKWYGLSILNEDEHSIQPDDGTAYTTCFDAVRAQLEKINSTIIPVGPEISGGCSCKSSQDIAERLLRDFSAKLNVSLRADPGDQFDYLSHVLNHSNHKDDYAPLIGSYHIGASPLVSSSFRSPLR